MPAGPLGVAATWPTTDWAAFVLDHLREQSVLMQAGARVVPVTGSTRHLPRLVSDGTAVWVAEATDIPSSAPTADDVVLTPRKLANVVNLSTESIEDSPVGELDAVGNAMTAAVATAIDARALSAAAATAVAPAGLLIAGYAIPAQTGGATSIDSYISAIGKVEAAGGTPNVAFVNPADLTALRLIKSAPTGSNEYVLESDPQQRGASQIAGVRLLPTSKIAAGSALLVQADEIVIGIRRDVRVEFSSHAKFTSDQVVARITFRADWSWNDVRGAVLIGT